MTCFASLGAWGGGFNYQPIIYYPIVLNVFYLSMLFLRFLMQTFSKKQEKTGDFTAKKSEIGQPRIR